MPVQSGLSSSGASVRSPLARAGAALALALALAPAGHATTLVVHARVLDGTGAPAVDASVRLLGDRIVAIGDLEPYPEGEEVVDAHGLTLAPGFIDTHSHASGGIFAHPDALADVSQGITTVVVG